MTILTSQYSKALPQQEHLHGVDIVRVPVAFHVSKGVIMPTFGALANRLVCNGHEHRAHIDRVRSIRDTEVTWVNPGTVAGVGAPATYILGNLATMEFAIRTVPEDDTVVSLPRAASGT